MRDGDETYEHEMVNELMVPLLSESSDHKKGDGLGLSPLQLWPFFEEFIKKNGWFDALVESCPLRLTASDSGLRDILGTMLLSILAGNHVYAHISTISYHAHHSDLLGMRGIAGKNDVIGFLTRINESAAVGWLNDQLNLSARDALKQRGWILDMDTSIKRLQGDQDEDAVQERRSANTPFNYCHSRFAGQSKVALGVEVSQGASSTVDIRTNEFWDYFDHLEISQKPSLIRGKFFSENEFFLVCAEKRRAPYLFKLKLSSNTNKYLVRKKFSDAIWCDSGLGYQAIEGSLKLTGWSHQRRILLIRPSTYALGERFTGEEDFIFLVTNIHHDLYDLTALYGGRMEMEKFFNELKRRWTWGGYATQNLKHSRLTSRMVALVYNWWLFFQPLRKF